MSRGEYEDYPFRIVDDGRFLEVFPGSDGSVIFNAVNCPTPLSPEEAREMAYFLNKFADEAARNRPKPDR
jgi:hypothetical protein